MKYELILQGDVKIVISDLEAKKILAAVNDKTEIIEIGDTRFRYSMFKGIFPLKEEATMDKDKWLAENQEWNESCRKMASYPIETKIDLELDTRIVPGLVMCKVDLPDELYEPMKANIRQFFEENPNYPRCPMRIWWPFIREKIAPLNEKSGKRPNPNIFQAQWWKIVMRNDYAIEEWLKYN